LRSLLTWQTFSRLGGYSILIVELRQVLIGEPVDTGLVVLAGGLLGVASAFRKNGGSE
jgi:hypothetical protein